MAPTRVLITFHSRTGETEKLAGAAALGAVQARALVRLRRVPDADASADDARNRDAVARMRREYALPARSDVEWADAMVLAGLESGDWSVCRDLLRQLNDAGGLTGKVAVVIDGGGRSVGPTEPIQGLDLSVLPPAGGHGGTARHKALIHGRRAAMAVTCPDPHGPSWKEAEGLLPGSHDID